MNQISTRRKPQQARSRALVESILEATIRVLVSRGYEGTTTVAVAARAGVSVGSLYQYFPNKESLVLALVERHTAEVLAGVDAVLAQARGKEPRQVIRTLIRAGMEAHRIRPALHKILTEEVPRVGRLKAALDTSGVLTDKLAAYLSQLPKQLLRRDPKVAAFIVEAALEAITHRSVIDHPRAFDAARIEAEAGELVMGYLFRVVVRVRRKPAAAPR